MIPSTKRLRVASRSVLGGISLAAIIAIVPVAAQEAADAVRESPGQNEPGPMSAGERVDASDDRASVQSTLKTETEIIRSLAPFSDGNPVARPGDPRPVDTGRGRVRVDYSHAIDITVFFDYDSARLTPEAAVQLEPLGRALQSRQLLPYRFLVAGHTDASGDPTYNRSLSLRRATTVRAYLSETYGVDPLRLVIHGWGQSRLKDPAQPFAGINRRVEIALIMPNVSSKIDTDEFVGAHEFAADIIPGKRLLVDRDGMNVRIVDVPVATPWSGTTCRESASDFRAHILSDPRWRLFSFTLDDFGATATQPCRIHGANFGGGTGDFGATPASGHRFRHRGSDDLAD
jgi:outer membrane protein OmpA-like peptidoglycan-associated protein